jgi:hypothetical protein
MKNFIAAAAKLDLTVEDILDILALDFDDIETENLSVNEILEAVRDCDCFESDWASGCDSVSNFIDA